MDGMREIRFCSKALFVGFKPRKESLMYVFNSIPYCAEAAIHLQRYMFCCKKSLRH